MIHKYLSKYKLNKILLNLVNIYNVTYKKLDKKKLNPLLKKSSAFLYLFYFLEK